MENSNWTLRSVSPEVLRSFLEALSAADKGLSWKSLSQTTRIGELSNARRWHYSSLLRCLGLVETRTSGHYSLTLEGKAFLSLIHGEENFSDEEITLLRELVLHCPPMTTFFRLMTNSSTPENPADLETLGRPLFMKLSRTSGTIENSFGSVVHLPNRTAVNQWIDGVVTLGRQLLLVDELRLPPGAVTGLKGYHIIYPVRRTSAGIRAAIDVYLSLSRETGRAYLPQMIFDIAVREGFLVKEFKNELLKFIEVNKGHVYLDRVSELSVKGYESCFLQIDGVWRSSISYEL